MPKIARKAAHKPAYHHGNLRPVLLDAALALVAEVGPAQLSLREVARRAGVSHAAPAHHFGDKAGLLTALATRGYQMFGAALRAGEERGGDDPLRRLSWQGHAYVMFAAEHRAYFELMFRPELLHGSDPELLEASRASYEQLLQAVRRVVPSDTPEAQIVLQATAAWAQAHGLATLWLDGNLAQHTGGDLDALARQMFALPAEG